MATDKPNEEQIFETAQQIEDAGDRTVYLTSACKGDEGLQTRLEEMLTAQDEAESFFASGATLVNSSETIGLLHSRLKEVSDNVPAIEYEEEKIGQRIDRYKLAEKIGEGGCGVVYLAEQEEPVRRQVALKIIRGGMETRSVIARFEAERQTLAMMDHPNIARVFDAGETGDGRPFFVMEHVRGIRITRYCDEHKLSIEERLNLFIQVCHAIQHAHQNCIVHGDIKPSNIMIAEHDGIAVPKVIDFGISKATEARRPEKHRHSTVAQLVGTPAYMSPEQVEAGVLEIDTRSDIYSLGVLLYELMTGLTPVDSNRLAKASIEEIRKVFNEHEILRPSERLLTLEPMEVEPVADVRRCKRKGLVADLQGDLDCILMKALQQDRRRRYETADAFAMDIVRFLNDEPVTAHPQYYTYRTFKLIRRNRRIVTAVGAVALALVAGTATSTWLFLKEREARQRAVSAEQVQADLRLAAETRESLTQAALLISMDEHEEADELIRDITLTESTMEGAAVFRSIGEWHAINGRWKPAADRFQVLLRINHLEGADVSSLDYLELGPVLMELGDMEAFENFRRAAIQRFEGKQNPFSDRIIKISLLYPADSGLLESMSEMVRLTELSIREAEGKGDTFLAAWSSMSLGLYEYRRGDFGKAIEWCEKSLLAPGKNDPRTAAASSIHAMALFQNGKIDAARDSLDLARSLISTRYNTPIDRGTPVSGFWFDWAFSRILMQEAETLQLTD